MTVVAVVSGECNGELMLACGSCPQPETHVAHQLKINACMSISDTVQGDECTNIIDKLRSDPTLLLVQGRSQGEGPGAPVPSLPEFFYE